MLVPLLITVGKLEDKQAFSSAISIILPLCLVSILIYHLQGNLSVSAALPYLFGGLAGGAVGGLLFRHMSAHFLHKCLGLVILWGGIRLIWN